ncbi:PREDICTED: protein MCM10 homolog [Wasmannia auropunctata]|uniref:protein MCM10 homolog n=1 Tax=Wasmannia auropunctata TaxID=64793 RepID=UPI0005EE0E7A|nr:PREDICTED: protein MCM10 homolog [Wasmannia auropunctata]XP_011697661.1 PREDICTED: protein MCM10 homolog [Wasmannia auropunctata]XP_011697669.1 PREDICTED: protein MCM10 homolog [Wasmannia auropunctata]
MEHEDSDCDLDILNNLISNNTEETEQSKHVGELPEHSTLSEPKKTLTELQFNFLDSTPSNINNEAKPTENEKVTSEIYDDKLDSSDDEDKRYFEEQKYSNYGREIKQLLKECSSLKTEQPAKLQVEKTVNFNFNNNKGKTFDFNSAIKGNDNSKAKDVYSDPFFGIRIVSPLVSSAELRDRMKDKIAVTVSRVKSHIISDNIHNDWVIAGVLINKSATKTSQKGTSYCIWKISDLSDDLRTVSVFLFSNAYKQLWKTIVGSVIGILNPNVLESKDNIDQATLSIDNPQKLMVLGRSKDMGKCKSVKKNGDPCTAVVNTSRCEYCVYHVKQEYKKCARRPDIQSSNTSYGFTGDAIKRMNSRQSATRKPYDGLASFVPVLAKRNEELYEKDRARLELLSESTSNNSIKKVKSDPNQDVDTKTKGISVELTNKQSRKDFERLNRLRNWQPSKQLMVQSTPNGPVLCSGPARLKESNPVPVKSPSSHTGKISLASLASSRPRLGAGCNRDTIDFSEPITKQQIRNAKMNAIKWVQEHGQIKAKNPNEIRAKEKLENNAKRKRGADETEERSAKKASISDKFKEMLEAKSSHTDLIEKLYDEEKEKYFNKLEAKERMEEKMMSTFKINCKAVTCAVCKYTAFSASDMCKEQRHPLRVTDAVKRFFKCTDCGNRTVSLNRMPSHSCGKCSGSNWVRAAMMDERKTAIAAETLSIRGAEEKFLGSAVKDANLNLLVPDGD